jgi:hypothetical protein
MFGKQSLELELVDIRPATCDGEICPAIFELGATFIVREDG